MKEWLLDPLKQIFRQWAFVACLVVMGISAGTLSVVAQTMKWYLHKYPVGLRKPIDNVNSYRLKPYKLVSSNKIEDKRIEEALGTQDYVQWLLEDTETSDKEQAHNARLFITYYTGEPDKVPHIPDVCYTGGGGKVVAGKNTAISVPGNGTDSEKLPVRFLQIEMPTQFGEVTQTVIYFFSVNGDYRCDRDEVRGRVNSIDDKHAYFSKVEMIFMGKMDEAAGLAAAQKLARVIVPILVEEHWPDWKAVKAEEAREERSLWQSFKQSRQQAREATKSK